MIVVYKNWKRYKEYKNFFLKNIKDQAKICIDLKLNKNLGLSDLEKKWIKRKNRKMRF